MRAPALLLAAAVASGCAVRAVASDAPTPAASAAPATNDTAVLRPRILTESLLPPTRARALPATRALGPFIDSLIGDPMFAPSHWGILVVDPLRGDTLYSANAGKIFLPASNMKLITGAVALAQLGADYRYTTRLLGRAPRRDGTMPGDLVVIGRGDPSVSDSLAGDAMRPLREFADSLAARGVRRITGRLISGANTFPDSTLGRGWAWDNLDEGYAAPVDELLFNEGFARVTVFGGARPGAPVRVRTLPLEGLPPIDSVGVITERNCCMLRSRVSFTNDVRGARPRLTLTGAVRANDSVTVSVALRDPAGAYLHALHEALRARGIRVDGGVEARALGDTTGMIQLASRRSPPLSAILAAFQKPSQNQIGEILLKTLGLERTGVGTSDSGRVVVVRQLLAWGIDSSGYAVRDGSGLSRHNYLAPTTIARVLDIMRQRDDFDAYYHALPVGGVDGTLRDRMRGTPAQANVHAKTGTLDKARALSGYVTSADGRVLVVSMLSNNHVVATREVERVQDAILAYLAAMDVAPAAPGLR